MRRRDPKASHFDRMFEVVRLVGIVPRDGHTQIRVRLLRRKEDERLLLDVRLFTWQRDRWFSSEKGVMLMPTAESDAVADLLLDWEDMEAVRDGT